MTARRLALAAVLLATALVAACSKSGGTSYDDLVAARKAAGTVNGLCPIQEQPVVPDVFVEYKGQKVGFCCGSCKKPFLNDPEKYLGLMRADPKKYAYQP